MIRLQIIGNLGKNAETVTINGNNYLKFSVCHSDKLTDQSGQQQTKTTWVDCIKKDENGKLGRYLLKGTKVYVDGKPQTNGYAAQDGSIKTNLSVIVNHLELLSRSEESQPAQQQHPVTGKVHTPFPPNVNNQGVPIDDLPF